MVSIASAVAEWFVANGRDLPWRRPGFTPWGTLVSEFMLQQTPVARVVPRLEEWLERWPTPADLAAEPPARRFGRGVGSGTRGAPCGCTPARSRSPSGTAARSRTRSRICSALPGVGDYTARRSRSSRSGRHPVVDTNVRRVLARAIGGQAQAGSAVDPCGTWPRWRRSSRDPSDRPARERRRSWSSGRAGLHRAVAAVRRLPDQRAVRLAGGRTIRRISAARPLSRRSTRDRCARCVG